MKVGDILVGKYGYNCTLVNFYVVKRITSANVWLQPMADIVVSHDDYGQAGFVIPGVEDLSKQCIRRKIHSFLDDEFIKIETYEYAELWNGKEVHFDTYD